MTVFFLCCLVLGEYHYEVVGCGYGWMSLGLKTLRSARNLMQNTLDYDVINPVSSQHDTCTYKAHMRGQVGLSIHIPKLWPVGGGRWLSSYLRLGSSMVHVI